jgi:hypothetical protein
MIDTEKLQKTAEFNRTKTAHLIEALRKAKISLIVDGGSFHISHNGGEYELIEKDPKQIGFVITED